MKKLLNVVLMLSVMASVVPAQAGLQRGKTRRQTGLQVALVPEIQDEIWRQQQSGSIPQDDARVYGDGVANEANDTSFSDMLKNHYKEIVSGAVAASALALVVAAAHWNRITEPDCNAVAQAYCDGSNVRETVLETCKANLPWVSCYLF